MAWGRLHDGANTNAKLIALSDGAFRLWAAGLIYCQANLTEGFVPSYAINTFGVRARLGPLVKELLAVSVPGKASLWHEVEGGWQMHDYLEWNDSRQTILNGRQTAKQRIALFRNPELRKQVRDRDGDDCRYCGRTVQWHDRKGARGGTYDHVEPYAGNDAANLVVCCRGCNSHKRGRTPAEAGMVLRDAPESKSQSRSDQTTDLDLFQQPQPRPLEQKNPGSTAPRGTSEKQHQNQRDGNRAPARMSLDSNHTRVLKRAMHATLDVLPTLDDDALIAKIAEQHLPGMKIAIDAVDIALTLQPLVDAVRNKRTPTARREQSVSPLLRDTLTLAGMKTGAAFDLFAGCYFVPNDMLQMALVVPDAARKEQIRPSLAELHHAFRKVSKSALRMGSIIVAPAPTQIIEGFTVVLPGDDVVHLCELAGIKQFFIGTIFDGAVLGHGQDNTLRLSVRPEAFEFVERQFSAELIEVARERMGVALEIVAHEAREAAYA